MIIFVFVIIFENHLILKYRIWSRISCINRWSPTLRYENYVTL